MSANIDAVVPAEENNKCALKLLGIDIGDVGDEDILDAVSNDVEPSDIKALFYDSFNCFYVLYLSDIKSTCLLVGKTIQISCYRVHFLPLFDCYVIGNVYMSVTNSDLKCIFREFGNVCEVANHHVLPRSSKYCHVLSGTRKIAFLLPGDDTTVDIPITVTHPPYTFHVRQFCNLCQDIGHSIMKCPARGQDTPVPVVMSTTGNCYEGLIGNSLVIKQELLLSIDKDDRQMEKAPEIQVGKPTTTSSEDYSALRNQEESLEISRETLSDNSTVSDCILRKRKKWPEVEVVDLNDNSSGSEEKILEPNVPSAKKNVQDSDTSKCLTQISLLLEKYILKVHGILESHEMIELVKIDARNRRNVISFVSNITTNFKAVLTQLRKILRKFLRDAAYNTAESRYKRKLTTLIKVLDGYKN